MRVCLVYDCLFPNTVGGAERWYRHLAERLVERGYEVTYLTRRQWADGEDPGLPGVEVIAVSRTEDLYDDDGQRKIAQTLRFGWGVLAHLVRNRRRYDVVHVSSFPYFGLLGARVALAGARARVLVDWHEVWTGAYWKEYLGGVKGFVGRMVQRACVRASPTAFVFSDMNAGRLRAEGLRSEPIKLAGLYTGTARATSADVASPREPLVVYAGRHIPEKQVPTIVPAIGAARERIPGLYGLILGDGPERPAVQSAIDQAKLGDTIEAPGFVTEQELRHALSGAEMLLLPSRREGYGIVVIEAAALGTPVVVVAGSDNAAVELVSEGVNGFVAPSSSPEDMAAAIVAVHEAGPALRTSTAEWFSVEAPRRSADASVQQVVAAYKASLGPLRSDSRTELPS